MCGVVLTLPMAFAQAASRHGSYSGQAWNGLRCDNDRSPLLVSVGVTPYVYNNDVNDGRWKLWVANDTAWNYGNWAGNPLAHSTGPDAGGYICAKSGDLLKINGMFGGGDMYLVYRASRTRSAADQIVSVRLGDKSVRVGDGCWWSGNGAGGYDMMCKVQ